MNVKKIVEEKGEGYFVDSESAKISAEAEIDYKTIVYAIDSMRDRNLSAKRGPTLRAFAHGLMRISSGISSTFASVVIFPGSKKKAPYSPVVQTARGRLFSSLKEWNKKRPTSWKRQLTIRPVPHLSRLKRESFSY